MPARSKDGSPTFKLVRVSAHASRSKKLNVIPLGLCDYCSFVDASESAVPQKVSRAMFNLRFMKRQGGTSTACDLSVEVTVMKEIYAAFLQV